MSEDCLRVQQPGGGRLERGHSSAHRCDNNSPDRTAILHQAFPEGISTRGIISLVSLIRCLCKGTLESAGPAVNSWSPWAGLEGRIAFLWF